MIDLNKYRPKKREGKYLPNGVTVRFLISQCLISVNSVMVLVLFLGKPNPPPPKVVERLSRK